VISHSSSSSSYSSLILSPFCFIPSLPSLSSLLFFIRGSRVSVPCLMVVGSCQDLVTILFVCGMWIRDLVSECWKGMTRYLTRLPPFSQFFSLFSLQGSVIRSLGSQDGILSAPATPLLQFPYLDGFAPSPDLCVDLPSCQVITMGSQTLILHKIGADIPPLPPPRAPSSPLPPPRAASSPPASPSQSTCLMS
jgi:hypothetical protein